MDTVFIENIDTTIQKKLYIKNFFLSLKFKIVLLRSFILFIEVHFKVIIKRIIGIKLYRIFIILSFVILNLDFITKKSYILNNQIKTNP
jgi:hypothetical protein